MMMMGKRTFGIIVVSIIVILYPADKQRENAYLNSPRVKKREIGATEEFPHVVDAERDFVLLVYSLIQCVADGICTNKIVMRKILRIYIMLSSLL